MFRPIVVGDNERVVVIRKRRFADILEPGVYWMFTLGRGVQLERHNTRDLIFASDGSIQLSGARIAKFEFPPFLGNPVVWAVGNWFRYIDTGWDSGASTTYSASWSDQGLRYYKGNAWYRTSINMPKRYDEGRPIHLWFSNIDESARVWINLIPPTGASPCCKIDGTVIENEIIPALKTCASMSPGLLFEIFQATMNRPSASAVEIGICADVPPELIGSADSAESAFCSVTVV